MTALGLGLKLLGGDFDAHASHVAELETRYGALAKQMAQTGEVFADVRDLSEALDKKVATITARSARAGDTFEGLTGDITGMTGVLADNVSATDAALPEYAALNAAWAKATEPATNLQKSLDAQVIGFQKGKDAAELFRTGVANLDPELAANIRLQQGTVDAHKAAAEQQATSGCSSGTGLPSASRRRK